MEPDALRPTLCVAMVYLSPGLDRDHTKRILQTLDDITPIELVVNKKNHETGMNALRVRYTHGELRATLTVYGDKVAVTGPTDVIEVECIVAEFLTTLEKLGIGPVTMSSTRVAIDRIESVMSNANYRLSHPMPPALIAKHIRDVLEDEPDVAHVYWYPPDNVKNAHNKAFYIVFKEGPPGAKVLRKRLEVSFNVKAQGCVTQSGPSSEYIPYAYDIFQRALNRIRAKTQ